MARLPESLRRWLAPFARPLAHRWRSWRYRSDLGDARPAGEASYVFTQWSGAEGWAVELRVPATRVSAEEAVAWCAGQTLAELRAVGLDDGGEEVWRVDAEGGTDDDSPALFFGAPPLLPEVYPAWAESALLVLAAEEVDAVVLAERLAPALGVEPRSPSELTEPMHRSRTLFAASSWHHDAATDRIRPLRPRVLVKAIDTGGTRPLEPGGEPAFHHRFRRGDYVASYDLGPKAELVLRDAAMLRRRSLSGTKPRVLVLAPFLARGGAEHTLFETLAVLRDRFEFAFVTLAPHRPELGDRRPDFETLSPRVYSLGDLVHPAAMTGILSSLLDSLGAKILYNANGTTLFYELIPRLKQERPDLRIVDHLYDHRVGYIDSYGPGTLDWLDFCVAENRRIAHTLTTEKGWPADRVPVIWPCGRRPGTFPVGTDAEATRRRLRGELGLPEDAVVLLTAARMHAQKRPTDLVRLAERVQDLERVHFLAVGGGPLEDEVDAAIEGTAARIRRLAFRDDIPDLLVACDAGCLVSDYEGLPVFLIESLQAGRPFLGTDVGDMGWLLRHTGAGWVVDEPGDLDALEAAVRSLADDDERARRAALTHAVAAELDVATCAERYGAALDGQPVTAMLSARGA
ncbi:MAG: glycosyltransferase family 4 protein [Acidobacteriota bacterium]